MKLYHIPSKSTQTFFVFFLNGLKMVVVMSKTSFILVCMYLSFYLKKAYHINIYNELTTFPYDKKEIQERISPLYVPKEERRQSVGVFVCHAKKKKGEKGSSF